MATATTPNLGLTTVEAGDTLPEAVTKTNFETLDQYVAAYNLTNKSGSSVPANSVVIADTTTNSSFTTTASAGARNVVGVTQATIANDASGIVRSSGISNVLVTAATSRGDWLTTSTTAGKAVPTTSSTPPVGAFAIALSSTAGAGTVSALLLGATAPIAYTLPTGANGAATSTDTLKYDTTAPILRVWNGSASVPAVTSSSAIRESFRAYRRQVALWSGSDDGSPALGFGTGTGVWDSVSNISGEPIGLITTTGTKALLGAADGSGQLSPNHSPRMLLRVQFPAASANVTYFNIGFIDTAGTTANGAYLRIVTTGNVFFVTRQGGSETATDLGALSRTTILGFEIETADAGVTWVCRNQAGTALATHTTNVPTASTALNYGYAATIATAGVSHGVSFMHVEATFT